VSSSARISFHAQLVDLLISGLKSANKSSDNYDPENNSHASKVKDVEMRVLVVSAILTDRIQNLNS